MYEQVKTAKDAQGETIRIGDRVRYHGRKGDTIPLPPEQMPAVTVEAMHRQGADGTILKLKPAPDPTFPHHFTARATHCKKVSKTKGAGDNDKMSKPIKLKKWPEDRLRTIDPECIPEDLLKSWWANMTGRKSGPARLEKWREGLDPETIKKRETQRLYRADRRARGLDSSTPKEK